jgi:hypothetical protein
MNKRELSHFFGVFTFLIYVPVRAERRKRLEMGMSSL